MLTLHSDNTKASYRLYQLQASCYTGNYKHALFQDPVQLYIQYTVRHSYSYCCCLSVSDKAHPHYLLSQSHMNQDDFF